MRLGPPPAVVLAAAVLALGCRTVVYAPPPPPPQHLAPELAARATASWKYDLLVTALTVPDDVALYGHYHDYGWWPGGTYAGVSGLPPGYWVYVAPTWYLWQGLRSLPPAPPAAPPAAAPPGE